MATIGKEDMQPQIQATVTGTKTPPLTAVEDALAKGTQTQQTKAIIELAMTPAGLNLITQASEGYHTKATNAMKTYDQATAHVNDHKKEMEDDEEKAWDEEQRLQQAVSDLTKEWEKHIEVRSTKHKAAKKKEATLRGILKNAGDTLYKARKNNLLMISGMQAGQKHKSSMAKVDGQVASKDQENIRQFQEILELNIKLETADATTANQVQQHVADKQAAERRAADLENQYSAMASAVQQASVAFQAMQAAAIPLPTPVVAPAGSSSA